MNVVKHTACGVLLSCLGALSPPANASTAGTVPATLLRFTPQYRSYAEVQPRSVVAVRAGATGVISELEVLPGQRVHPGQVLAKLAGPEYDAAMDAALGRRDAARSNLETMRRNYPQFSSAQDVANAQAALQDAQSVLDQLQAGGRIVASTGGTVLELESAKGERIIPGETLLTLQPSDQLWLHAVYYGDDAASIRVGMEGQFVPVDGGEPIPVKVATVFGALAPDGGESVGLLVTVPATRVFNGEFGTVTLKGPVQKGVVVPTRALILDRGRWWVLVSTPQGLKPQQVLPGPAHGWETFIEHGLAPGMHVLAENAYLEFHRDIAQHYQPPD